MDNGWVVIHRKIQDWEWYQNPKMVLLFLHLLTSANHEKGQWQGHTINKGQLITGLYKLKEKTGISLQSLRTCLSKLKSTNEITIKSTSKFSIITIVKWDDYQIKKSHLTIKSTSKLTNEQQTTNKQLTTNNNDNNDNNLTGGNPRDKRNPEIQLLWDYGLSIGFATTKQVLNRYAIHRLLKTRTVEQLKKALEYSQKIKDESYAPQVNNWMDLEIKYPNLKAWVKKNANT